MAIVLNHKKLLGFRILNCALGGKAGVKVGQKSGAKTT
jgi:hypothetical protein